MRLFVTMVTGNHGHGPTMSPNVSRFKVDTVTCQVILCRKATQGSISYLIGYVLKFALTWWYLARKE